ncbi:hypothetical protein [Anaeromyxobacter oryzisoli]|uniref:hypothetical protein n=1 Tax=Anaeromyxobacter oryzisoli TaxID=2925408 RepID=UPI001F5A053A|nr:hypothetical protein [Anaeromyxobacter sp. SG63]
MAVAVVTRHSPSRCLREIGSYAVILGERQQHVASAGSRHSRTVFPFPSYTSDVSPIRVAWCGPAPWYW